MISRKILVPVIAILMCGVALAGVAYALAQTTVTSNDDTVDYGAFTIDLTSNGQAEVTSPWFANTPVVDFGRVKTVGNATPTWNVALHGSNVVAQAQVKVTAVHNDTTAAHTTFTLGAVVTPAGGSAITDVVTFTVEYSTDNSSWSAVGAGVASLTIGTDYYVRVIATLTGNSVDNATYTDFVAASKSMTVGFTASIN